MSEMTVKKKLFKRDNLMRYISIACIVVLAIVFEQIQPNFLGRMNIVSMLRDNAVLLILAVGMTSVLIFGSIDLSMGAMCSIANVLYVRIIILFGEKYKAAGVENPPYMGVMLLAIAVCLLVGMASGLLMGLVHVKPVSYTHLGMLFPETIYRINGMNQSSDKKGDTMAIMTVLGPVADLGGGHCQMHEHLFVQETPASLRNPALKIDDEVKSIEELRRYRAAGGGAILDAQPVGAGRELAALRRISLASGFDIISVTGYHLPAFYPKNHWILSDSVEELAERFLSELNEGVETREGKISPGAVKAAIGPEGAAGQFRVCLRAAARAAARAQVPLILHTEKGIGAPEAVELCAGEGLDPARIAVCHADRQADDPRPHDEIAASGVYMEYDTIARYKYHDDERCV